MTTPAATQPAAPAPKRPVAPYIFVAIIIALSQGLSQGFVSANLPQMAGDLGVSASDASWLMAAYMIPRASLPLLLTKLRTQYGLLKFAKTGTFFAAITALASCFVSDFHSAVTLQFIAGCAAAPMSTLAFLYMLEPLPQKMKLVLGLPLALSVIMTAPNLARLISPSLIGDGGFAQVHLLILGLSLLALSLVLVLPLAPAPTAKVLVFKDITTFALIAAGFAAILIAMIMGPIHWWSQTPWIGVLLALGSVALTLAVLQELYRPAPMIDFRWLASPAMLQMSAAMLMFRILLSEQSTGAPRMFQVLGYGPDALQGLFFVVSIAGMLAPLACLAFLRPGREPLLHILALLMIALGCWLDSKSTIATRPIDMALSQMLIAFAGMIFMAPAMVMGLLSALKRGPSYLMSFIVVFISTQSLGGIIGSGLFTTLTNDRQAHHYQHLSEQIVASAPQLQGQIAQNMALLSNQTSDMAALKSKAVAMVLEDATKQSWVMAYNDAYWLCAMAALAALAVLLLHMLLLFLRARLAPPPTPIPS